MTVAEMHFDFEIKLDKVDSQHRQDFNPAHKDWLLNEAQNIFIKQRYGLTNIYRSGFESIQKRIDDLSMLHVKYPAQPGIYPIMHDEGVYELPLSELKFDYLFFTRGQVEVVEDDCVSKASLKLIQNDDLNSVLQDPFNSPSKSQVLVNFGTASESTNPALYLYSNSLNLRKVFIEYIRKPSRINLGGYTYLDGATYPSQDCELAPHTHSEIVDIAVNLAASIVENPNLYQTTQNKLEVNE